MRKHICLSAVKVARFPSMSEVSGSIPVSGLCFLLIFVVFTMCLKCSSITPWIIQYCSPVCTYSRIMHEKT